MNEHENTVLFVSWVFAHVASGVAVVAALAGYLPPLAALIAFVWYIIQICESETFRKWQARRRLRRIKALEEHLTQLRKHHDVVERSDT